MAAVFLLVGFVVVEESADESVSELLSTKRTPCTIKTHIQTAESFLYFVSFWLMFVNEQQQHNKPVPVTTRSKA
jgi:hypothetical protein